MPSNVNRSTKKQVRIPEPFNKDQNVVKTLREIEKMSPERIQEERRRLQKADLPENPAERETFMMRVALFHMTPEVAEAAGFDPNDIPLVALPKNVELPWDYFAFGGCWLAGSIDVDAKTAGCACHCMFIVKDKMPDCVKACSGSDPDTSGPDDIMASNTKKQMKEFSESFKATKRPEDMVKIARQKQLMKIAGPKKGFKIKSAGN